MLRAALMKVVLGDWLIIYNCPRNISNNKHTDKAPIRCIESEVMVPFPRNVLDLDYLIIFYIIYLSYE